MIKFGVISFPGNNCEMESVRAIKRSGMDAEIVLWNDPAMLDGSRTSEFHGYLIPGGFSYEDRGRSGVIAAQDPVTEVLKKEADKGKVIIGICNGAQILVETGLVPGFDNKGLAVALTWNEMRKDGEVIDTGFYCIWPRLKNTAKQGRCAFNDFDELLHIPMAHGEGRFVIDSEVLEVMKANDQIVFKYATPDGIVATEFPDAPNGATEGIAAICNPAGNVMAIMPHPERDPEGNGQVIFDSIKRWIEEKKTVDFKSLGNYECKEDIRSQQEVDIQMLVRLIITDNTERTIEEALIRKGFNIHLDRYLYYGIKLQEGQDVSGAIRTIIETGELANLNKEIPYIKTKEGLFIYDKENGLLPKDLKIDHYVIAADQGDFVGEAKKNSINLHAGHLIKEVHHGILWNFSEGDDQMDEVIASKVLYNPHSMYLMKA